MEKPISSDTQGVTQLIWSFIFSSGFHALILSHARSSIWLLEQKMRLLMYLCSSIGWVGWERDVCTCVGLGRCAWWWKFHRWTLRVQNTFIILIMVEKPTSRPMEFCHICRKGKLYTPCGYGCIQGQYFRNEEEKGFSFFLSSLFLFEIREDKWHCR